MKTPNRPPSCDLPPEFYQTKLKPCPFCGSARIDKGHGSIFCLCCGSWLFTADSHVHKWNSIPRRSEVLELIRLVDEVVSWDDTIIDTHNFPEDGLAMAHDFKKLREYANKLRKEMGE